jgi:hypothetical protein
MASIEPLFTFLTVQHFLSPLPPRLLSQDSPINQRGSIFSKIPYS